MHNFRLLRGRNWYRRATKDPPICLAAAGPMAAPAAGPSRKSQSRLAGPNTMVVAERIGQGAESDPRRQGRPAAMMVAGDKDRKADEDQGGDQTAPPPALLPRQLLLEPIKTSADLVFSLISSSTCFFRHRLDLPRWATSIETDISGVWLTGS
jgi:hypothetical protein